MRREKDKMREDKLQHKRRRNSDTSAATQE